MTDAPNFDRIRGNVRKILSGGGNREQVGRYLQGEGVTSDQLRADRDQRKEAGMFGSVVNAVSDGAQAVADGVKYMTVGDQDPNFSHLSTFGREDAHDLDMGLTFNQMFGQNDEQYRNLLMNDIRESGRLVDETQDAKGNHIVSYRNRAGEIQQRYINAPWLDHSDVDRAVFGSLPYVAGGVGAGAILKGAPLVARMAGQAGTAAGVSVASDVTANAGGSRTGIDDTKAAFAAGGGLIGEALAPALTRIFRGRQVRRDYDAPEPASRMIDDPEAAFKQQQEDLRALSENSSDIHSSDDAGVLLGEMPPIDASPELWTAFSQRADGLGYKGSAEFAGEMAKISQQRSAASPGARMSDAARHDVQQAGLNPDEFTEDQARKFAERRVNAANPVERDIAARTDEFGIPTTRGQRTKDEELLQLEREMQRGLMGQDAKQIMNEFNENQSEQIGRAVTSRHFTRATPDSQTEGGRQTLGALDAAQGAARSIEREAWSKVGTINATPEGLAQLGPRISSGLGDIRVTRSGDRFRHASQSLDELQKLMDGTVPDAEFRILGNRPQSVGLDEVRRDLLAILDDAKANGSRADVKATSRIYGAYNDWIGEIAEQGLVDGPIDAAGHLLKARDMTRQMRQLFEPRDSRGRSTAAARIMQRLSENANSPEKAIDLLFGGSHMQKPSEATLEVLSRIKNDMPRLLGQADEETGRALGDAWKGLRSAYWIRLVQGRDGKFRTPHMMQKRINEAMHNQPSVFRLLYTPGERQEIGRLVKALEDAVHIDPNPSGTSYALESMRQRRGQTALGNLFKMQQRREFMGRGSIVMHRIYGMLATKMPGLFNLDRFASQQLARRATSQELTPRGPFRTPATAGAVAGAQVGADQRLTTEPGLRIQVR